ncbi:MAG: aminotransferase class V-fold PLP-dependent enzyme [bacterium]|nr:aminotransferase class V-fold PLP-dependent enzyme [bacterium]
MHESSLSRRSLCASLSAALLSPRAAFARGVESLESQEPEPVSLRDAYDLAPDVTYLNHASIGTMPTIVREAHDRYELACERNPWLHVWGEEWSAAIDEVHAHAAERVGCEEEEIAVTRSTTEGFNVLAGGLPLGADDEVVFSSLNHVGASAAWTRYGRERGYAVRRFRFPTSDVPDMSPDEVIAAHVEALSDASRVLVLPHVDNVVGLRHPVARIARAARARGVEWVCVDGAQTVGMIDVDLDALGVDAYTTSAHKWLQAPKGTGLLYVRGSLQEQLAPLLVTWGQGRWAGTARSYTDYGTRDLPKLLALEDALTFQERVAGRDRDAHDRRLFAHALARVEAHAKLTWRSPRGFEHGAALYAVGLEGAAAPEVARVLFERHGVVVRPFGAAGLNSLRVSPNTLNTTGDLDRFFEAVESCL